MRTIQCVALAWGAVGCAIPQGDLEGYDEVSVSASKGDQSAGAGASLTIPMDVEVVDRIPDGCQEDQYDSFERGTPECIVIDRQAGLVGWGMDGCMEKRLVDYGSSEKIADFFVRAACAVPALPMIVAVVALSSVGIAALSPSLQEIRFQFPTARVETVRRLPGGLLGLGSMLEANRFSGPLGIALRQAAVTGEVSENEATYNARFGWEWSRILRSYGYADLNGTCGRNELPCCAPPPSQINGSDPADLRHHLSGVSDAFDARLWRASGHRTPEDHGDPGLCFGDLVCLRHAKNVTLCHSLSGLRQAIR